MVLRFVAAGPRVLVRVVMRRFLGLLEPRPFASSWGIPPVDWLASSPAPMTWVQHCTMQFALRVCDLLIGELSLLWVCRAGPPSCLGTRAVPRL